MRQVERESTRRLRMTRPRRGPNEKIPWVLRVPVPPRPSGSGDSPQRGGGRKGCSAAEAPPRAGLGSQEAWLQGRKEPRCGGYALGREPARQKGAGVIIPPQNGRSGCTSPRSKKGPPPTPLPHTSTQRRKHSRRFPSSRTA